jgi:HPt (histidine-containing phosphotransfer) domain-containing protein
MHAEPKTGYPRHAGRSEAPVITTASGELTPMAKIKLLEIIEAAQEDTQLNQSVGTVSEHGGAAGSGVIDGKNLVRVVLEDQELLKELIEIFLNDYEKRMDKIREATMRGESENLRSAAHGLKGSVGTMAAPRALEAALRLERAAKSNNFPEAEEAFKDLEAEVSLLVQTLSNIVAKI